ncbi:hypothetical protein BMS3Abin12_01719 [bacterium BMS3Abin12]|nr:hypothetical protein BMS3Abin12_01719 [bacterium BMS3Abin12]
MQSADDLTGPEPLPPQVGGQIGQGRVFRSQTTNAHKSSLTPMFTGHSCDHDFKRFSGLKHVNPLVR